MTLSNVLKYAQNCEKNDRVMKVYAASVVLRGAHWMATFGVFAVCHSRTFFMLAVRKNKYPFSKCLFLIFLRKKLMGARLSQGAASKTATFSETT